MEVTQSFKLIYHQHHKVESIRNWNINQQNQFGIKLFPAQMYAMIFSWSESCWWADNGFIKGHVYVNPRKKIVIADKYNLMAAFNKLAFEGGNPVSNGVGETINKTAYKNPLYFESFVPSQSDNTGSNWQERPEINFHPLSLPAWEFVLPDYYAEMTAEKWGKQNRLTSPSSGIDERQIVYAKLTGDTLTVAFKPDVCLADFIAFPQTVVPPMPRNKHVGTKLLWQPHDLVLGHVERPDAPGKPHFALVEKKGEALYTCGSEGEVKQLVLSMLDNDNLGTTVWHIGRLWIRPAIRNMELEGA
jgi:hypothetical protein